MFRKELHTCGTIKNGQKIKFTDIVIDDDCRWGWDFVCDALYRWDNYSRKMSRVGNFNGKINQISYYRLLSYNNKLIGVPCLSDEIMIYDKEKDEFRYVEVGISELHSEVYKSNKFMEGIIEGSYVYFSGYSSYVLKMNLDTEKIEGYVDLYENIPGVSKTICTQGAILLQGKMYILSCDYNYIFEVEPETLTYTKIEIPDITGGFYAGCRVGSDIWIVLQEKSEIIKWTPKQQKVEKKEICLKNYTFLKYSKVGLIIHWDDMLWIVNLNPKQLIGMSLKTGEWKYQKSYCRYLEGEDSKTIWEKRPLMIKQYGNSVICLMSPDLEFVCFDLENDTIKKDEYLISGQELEERRQNMELKIHIREHRILTEKVKRLEDFLGILKENNYLKKDYLGEEMHSFGCEIYRRTIN